MLRENIQECTEELNESQKNDCFVRTNLRNGFQDVLPNEMSVLDFDDQSSYFRTGLEYSFRSVGLFANTEVIPWENLSLVAYRYPENSLLESGFFITSRAIRKNMIVGLPGSSTEVLGDRPYVGVTLDKQGTPRYHCCLGNGISEPVIKGLGSLDRSEAVMISNLFRYFKPGKEIKINR